MAQTSLCSNTFPGQRWGLVSRFEATITTGIHTTVNRLTATETQRRIYRYFPRNFLNYTADIDFF